MAIGAAKVGTPLEPGVESTSLGLHRAKLRVRQRAQEREESRHRPYREREPGVSAGLSQHAARDEIDPRADHGPDRDQHQVREAEASAKFVRAGHGRPGLVSADDDATSV